MYMDNPERVETLWRQLTAFSQFSTRSLGESNIEALMLDACLRSRVGLNVTHAKLMEYIPERDRLLLRGDRARSSPDLPAGSRFQTSHRSLA